MLFHGWEVTCNSAGIHDNNRFQAWRHRFIIVEIVLLTCCILDERHVITLFQPPSWIYDLWFHLTVLEWAIPIPNYPCLWSQTTQLNYSCEYSPVMSYIKDGGQSPEVHRKT